MSLSKFSLVIAGLPENCYEGNTRVTFEIDECEPSYTLTGKKQSILLLCDIERIATSPGFWKCTFDEALEDQILF